MVGMETGQPDDIVSILLLFGAYSTFHLSLVASLVLVGHQPVDLLLGQAALFLLLLEHWERVVIVFILLAVVFVLLAVIVTTHV